MIKLNRVYAFAAAAICALAISCTSAPKDNAPEAGADAKAPAAAAAPAEKAPEAAAAPAEETGAVTDAFIGFIEATKNGDPSLIKYLDTAAKENVINEATKEMKGEEADKAKAEISKQLDDANSELAKSVAAEMVKKETFKDIDTKEIKNTAKVRIEGDQAFVSDGVSKEEIHFVKEADGWKISHEVLGL